jgi:hypothetical protein
MGRVGLAQFLCHDQFRATFHGAAHFKFVHEGSHQKNATTGSFQKVLFGKRVRHLLRIKSSTLINDMHYKFLVRDLETQLDLFVPLLLVSVSKRIDDAFPYGHSNFKAIVIVEAGCSGNAFGYAFGQSDAIEQRLHGDFDPIDGIGHGFGARLLR